MLVSAIGVDQAERGVIAQAIVHGEVLMDAPRILSVEAEPLHVLREPAIAGDDRLIGRISKIYGESTRVGGVETWVLRQPKQNFRIVSQSSAQYRFMDEVDPKLGRMVPRRVGNVITELIFLLVTIERKSGNRRDELIVAKSFKP